jgi:transposase-like protein
MASDGSERQPGVPARGVSGAVGPRAANAQRRVFSSAYKLRIVEEYDGLTEHGARDALLRREGLYQSHVEKWRKARDTGRLTRASHSAKPSAVGDPRRRQTAEKAIAAENRRLQEDNERLAAELEKTRAVAEILGKAHALLEMISEGAEKPTPSTR